MYIASNSGQEKMADYLDSTDCYLHNLTAESDTTALGATRWGRYAHLKQVDLNLNSNIRLLRPDSIR